MNTLRAVCVFAAVGTVSPNVAAQLLDSCFTDDFEDGDIDASLWHWGCLNRGLHGPGGNWECSVDEVIASDGYLRMHVWGPPSGDTHGAEAWTQTLYDYNDGRNHTIRFRWEAAVNVPAQDDHFNRYYMQITDGYISPDGSVHWPRSEAPIPGTVNLLLDSDGEPGGYYPNGRDAAEWTMTIGACGIARLYDENGDLLTAEPLDPTYPWFLRFMVIDATSSGFPAGDIEMNLFDFSSSCEAPASDPCDMNCDGDVNAFDIEPFLDLLFGGAQPCGPCTGDVNVDGAIDAFDIEPFLNCLFP